MLDSFDSVSIGTKVTRNLLDNLLSLTRLKSLTLVTGSRRQLIDICKTKEARLSFFWEIFSAQPPIKVTAPDEVDLVSFLGPLKKAGSDLDPSAHKEIVNWTGGVPVLVCALLQKLWDEKPSRKLLKKDVDEAAEALRHERNDLLAGLWEECDVDLRADLGVLADGTTTIPRSRISEDRLREIEDRGFGRVSGKNLASSCRLIQRYVQGQKQAVTDLNRLFGTASDFETNVRALLELRLKQVRKNGKADETICRYVSQAIKDIQPDPYEALTRFRIIVDHALGLIWKAEFSGGKTLMNFQRDELPTGLGPQLSILDSATGKYNKTGRETRFVTKKTYFLVNHLKSLRDVADHPGQYPDIKKVSVGFVAAALLDAIALVENLAAELP